jgi:arginine:agmatine antiporter
MARDMEGADGHARVGVVGATGLVAGGMIGSGVFLLPATMGAMGSISILGWLAATAVALALALQFAWLARAAPEARGLAGYVEAGLGSLAGLQTSFLYWVSNWVGAVAVAVAVAGYVAFLVPDLGGPGARFVTTLAVIWLGVLAVWFGPRAFARAQGLTLALGLAPVLLTATAGWLWFDPHLFVRSWNPQGLGLGPAIGASALAAIWAFTGVEGAAAVAGVVRDPERNVPRATLIGLTLTAALYIGACAVLMGVLSSDRLGRSTAPFADAAGVMVGAGVAGTIAVCAAVRLWGCFATSILSGTETSRSAADAGMFLRGFRTRPGEQVSPVNLLVFGGLMSLVAVGTATPTLGSQFSTLANTSVLLTLYAYALAAGSLAVLARGFGRTRRMLAFGLAGVTTTACAWLTFSAKPVEIAWSLAAVALGAVLHLYLRRPSVSPA